MSLSKRQDSPFWWYDFTVQGVRFRGSTETADRQLAQTIETRLKDGRLRQEHLGDKPTLTLDHAAGRFLSDHAAYIKSGRICVVHYCGHLVRLIGGDTPFHAIDDARVSEYVSQRRKEQAKGKDKPISNSTINRELATFANMRSKIERWGYQVGNVEIRRHKLPEAAHRLRWLTPEEADRLICACKPYLRQIVQFALMTGMRRGNILSLQRENIDRVNGIKVMVKSAKPGGKPHTIPLTRELEAFLKDMGWKEGQDGPLFIKRGGGGFKDIKQGFSKACKRAKLKDFRFHDLRHTHASWLVQAGVPLSTVKELLGHENIQTTMRYAHLHAEAKKEGLEKIAARLRHVGLSGKNKPNKKKAA